MTRREETAPITGNKNGANGSALRIVFLYAIFACLWILLSDKAVALLFSDPAEITLISTAKGWLFVVVTSLLLYGLIRRLLSQVLTASQLALELEIEKNHSDQLLKNIVDSSPDAIFAKDLEGRYTLFNTETARVFGKIPAQAIGRDDSELFPAQAEMIRINDRRVIVENQINSYEETVETANGERTYFAIKGPLRDDQNSVIGIFGISRDITDQKRIEASMRESEERYRTAFMTSPDSININRLTDGLYLDINEGFTRLVGWTRGEVIGKTSRDINIWHNMNDRQRLVQALQRDGYCKNLEADFVAKDGKVITALMSAHVMTAQGEKCILSVTRDITERKTAEDKINHLAFFDPLTSLPNRRLLLDRVQQALASSARSKREGAILFIDLDNFKTLNDTLGHETGDTLLKLAANRLTDCIREGDTVARLGGDEFVVMLEDLSENPKEAATQAEAVGEKILSELSQPYQLSGGEYCGTTSIGITLFADHHDTIDDLLKRADLAMYKAKAEGRNTLRFYDPEMQAVVVARASMEADLREGVQKNQFLLHYQPQVGLDGRMTGVEALVRWQHPRRGLVSPNEFIALAEETGLILPLGHWVLESACMQLVIWATKADTSHLTVAVNVSARQFRHPDFVAQVMAILHATGADPHRLKLELTESLLLDNVEDIIAKMTALRVHGVAFSLDDFGTGYSSLSYLKRLPLDQLKIDQSFVRDVLTDQSDTAIVRTIVALAQNLGLAVIAEGVETEQERDFLASHGCNAYQGYFYGRPGPVESIWHFASS